MKTILVATDFSKPAKNAINYAFEMAKISGAKLVLFHVLPPPPMITTDIPIAMPLIGDLKEDCLKSLKKIKKDLLLKKGREVKVEVICRCGICADEIYNYTLEKPVDLVVMGMEGAGYLKERLMGSVTTDVIRKSEIPVLSIGRGVKFSSIKRIVFADDKQGISHVSSLKPVKEISMIFKSHIYILNVITEKPTIANGTATDGKVKRYFKDIEHSFHSSAGKTVVDGINDFVAKKRADMVVMIPRKHSLMETIFGKRKTKEMAFHSRVPLLSIHDKRSNFKTTSTKGAGKKLAPMVELANIIQR